MAQITIAKLSKLVKAHQAAAEEYARFPEDDDARKKLSDAAFAYVGACLFLDDGKEWGMPAALGAWTKSLRTNGCAHAAAAKLVAKKPYQGVFELSGAVPADPKPKKGKRK